MTSKAPQAGDAAHIQRLRRTLLLWYRNARRDLPWRRTQDPYAIWISEIMLQQTRVDVVIPYYERFLQRFPNAAELAQAPLDDVLQAWAGLGYYRRARNLHAAAQHIVSEYKGRFPRHHEDVLALPGVGRYTAGAIGSIAFGDPLPIVDGNVMRVLARFFAVRDDIDASETRKRFWEWADQWAAGPHPGDANQALMELGALLCHRSSPRCDVCAVAPDCTAHQQAATDTIPVRKARAAPRDVTLTALLLRRRGRLLLVRRKQGRLLEDFWEIPTVPVHTAPTPTAPQRRRLDAAALRHLQLQTRTWEGRGNARHDILQHRIEVQVVEGVQPEPTETTATARVTSMSTTTPGKRASASQLENLTGDIRRRWTTPRELQDLPLTTLSRKALQAAARNDSSWEDYARRSPTQKAPGQRRHQPSRQNPK